MFVCLRSCLTESDAPPPLPCTLYTVVTGPEYLLMPLTLCAALISSASTAPAAGAAGAAAALLLLLKCVGVRVHARDVGKLMTIKRRK